MEHNDHWRTEFMKHVLPRFWRPTPKPIGVCLRLKPNEFPLDIDVVSYKCTFAARAPYSAYDCPQIRITSLNSAIATFLGLAASHSRAVAMFVFQQFPNETWRGDLSVSDLLWSCWLCWLICTWLLTPGDRNSIRVHSRVKLHCPTSLSKICPVK